MSNSIRSLQATSAQTQIQQTVLPPKKTQTTPQSPVPYDTVTISTASQQAEAGNTNAVALSGKNRGGETA